MVSIFGGVVFLVGFLLVSVPFLCFWMLWAVVFILGRWLVWWVGFLWRFLIFAGFCQFIAFQFCEFLYFFGGG